jgi:hypothetical protein
LELSTTRHPHTSSAGLATPEETKELARLRNAAKRHDTYRRQRDLKIEEIHQLLLQKRDFGGTQLARPFVKSEVV